MGSGLGKGAEIPTLDSLNEIVDGWDRCEEPRGKR